MRRTLFECAEHPNEWILEEIDMEDEGQVYQTVFSGPQSEARASEYTNWRGGITNKKPPRPRHQRRSVADHV